MDESQAFHAPVYLVYCVWRRASPSAAFRTIASRTFIIKADRYLQMIRRTTALERCTRFVERGGELLSPSRDFFGPHEDVAIASLRTAQSTRKGKLSVEDARQMNVQGEKE
jgi:hypothetical protein